MTDIWDGSQNYSMVRNLRNRGDNGTEPVTRNMTGRQRAVEHISNDIIGAIAQ